MTSEFEQKQTANKLREIRAERYACQSVARKALPKERIVHCLRTVAKKDVEVWKHRKSKKSFYAGLIVCGSVWTCPVCAAKISERRRAEVKQAIEIHQEKGGSVALLTLTFSHKKTDRLKDTIYKFGQATQRFMSGGAYNEIRKKLDLIGRIRAFEVTYGQNGFHPHAHIALFYNNKVDLEEIQKLMYPLYERACQAFGLNTSAEYGMDLQEGDKVDKYLSKYGKWGLDQEMTKSHIKKSRDGLSPFDFLRKYLEEEDAKYLKLFKEYAECFKGKRQLQWSQGLKKQFIVEEKSDEQLAIEKREEADLLGLLDYEFWKKILRYDERSKFLDLCEKEGFEKAVSFTNESIDRFEKKKRQVPAKNLPVKKI